MVPYWEMRWSSFRFNEIVNYALLQIISLFRLQWPICWSRYAPCHLMQYTIYMANGYLVNLCAECIIVSMYTFQLPVFYICVVYRSIGKYFFLHHCPSFHFNIRFFLLLTKWLTVFILYVFYQNFCFISSDFFSVLF